MKEICCQFGENLHLAGIVTEPPDPHSLLVLVSAGLSPKYGPFRLYAQLARRLARDGILTLRFDLGGIGDSQQAYPALSFRRRACLEIRAAVDWLTQAHPVRDVRVGGLCSGAEEAFRYAEQDARISGVVLIDPFAYRTPGWRWRNLLLRIGKRVLSAVNLYRPVAAPESLVSYRYMDQSESTRILGSLLERQVGLHFFYTGGMSDVFNHPGQFREMFPGMDLKGRVSIDYLPRLGHTQLLDEDRRRLIETVGRRLVRRP